MSHYEFERKAIDGLSLYFQGWQTEQNQNGVICLMHGLGEHSGRYEHWAGMLNLAGYSFLTYDLRGHGRSEGIRGHISNFNEYLNDTDLLLKEAEDRYTGTPCFLYGHSLGALIVTDYVLRRKPKIAGAIITALSTKNALQEQKGKVMLAKVLGSITPKVTLKSGLDPLTISRDSTVVSKYKDDPMVHSQVSTGFGKGSLDAIDWINKHASEWTLPVLIMHGELDRLGNVEGSVEFASKIKGDCTLKIWPGMFHEVHNEPEKQEVFDYLHAWLNEHAHI
jgi:acylglycerol lipase